MARAAEVAVAAVGSRRCGIGGLAHATGDLHAVAILVAVYLTLKGTWRNELQVRTLDRSHDSARSLAIAVQAALVACSRVTFARPPGLSA
jgi:hypothetical protein